MKTSYNFQLKKLLWIPLLLIIISTGNGSLVASQKSNNQKDTLNYVQFKGFIVDQENRQPLVFASISLMGTNITSISNSEGLFSIKVPVDKSDGKILITYLGYKDKICNLVDLKPDKNRIELEVYPIAITEVNVYPKDPDLLIRAILNNRSKNYSNDLNKMTAFYRETIKKRKAYVSLSEAVIEVYKQPIVSLRSDQAELFKGRKNTDYAKLDTVTFKLQGGPYTSLYLDIMKNPDLIFTDDMMGNYMFSLDNISKIGDRLIYIIGFKQQAHIKEPLYYGKLFVDTETLAVINATFSLNVTDKIAAGEMFIRKKPFGAKVYPTEANYQVNYRESNGRWYFEYSRAEIIFKIDWNKKFFNTFYQSTIEMAATDLEKLTEKALKSPDRLKPSVVMMDQVTGFADPEFWGDQNVIEPEKSIEQAIKKIQRKIGKGE